jgi:chorismate mutase
MLYDNNAVRNKAAAKKIFREAGFFEVLDFEVLDSKYRGQMSDVEFERMSDAINAVEAAKYIDITNPASAARIRTALKQARLPAIAFDLLQRQARDYTERVALLAKIASLKIDLHEFSDHLDRSRENEVRRRLTEAGLPDTAFETLLEIARDLRRGQGIPNKQR